VRAWSSKLCWGVALSAILSSATAWPAEPKRPRFAVLGLPIDPADPRELVNTAIAQLLRDQGLEVVSPKTIAAALEKRPGCAEASCFAELASACGADLILRAALAAEETGSRLTLTLLDRTGQPLAEVAKTVADRAPGSLVEAAEEEIPKLVQPLLNAGLATPPPAASASVTRSHLASYALMVSGAALLLGSGAIGYAADSASSALDNAVSGSTPGNIPALRSSVSTEAWVSTGLTLGGVAAIAVGLVLFYAGGSSSAPQAIAASGAPTLAWSF
jgi:hypothetical protein